MENKQRKAAACLLLLEERATRASVSVCVHPLQAACQHQRVTLLQKQRARLWMEKRVWLGQWASGSFTAEPQCSVCVWTCRLLGMSTKEGTDSLIHDSLYNEVFVYSSIITPREGVYSWSMCAVLAQTSANRRRQITLFFFL